MVTVTNNRNITLPDVGGMVGTWGNVQNSAIFSWLDNILGVTQPISITSADVILSIPQWNNCAINLTGALTGNHNLILPFNANSGTVAVGGLFVVQNNTTGAFNVTVITQAGGSTGVVVPQGYRAWLYSDTVNVWYAEDAALHITPWNGNPNGFVAGTAGAVNKPPQMVWDYANSVLYACTSTGTTTTAIWTNIVASGAPQPQPQGYLTPVSNTAIITSDAVAATNIYYTPYVGSWAAVHNGTSIIAFQFSQMQLTLSASQAANNIYDVYLAFNGGTPVIGTGPSWAAGTAGSVTAGSCARGTGVGGAAINRATNGLWVNTAAISLIWNTGSGNNTIAVPAGQGIFLGSVYIDATAGQYTSHRLWGQNRKWGLSNAYNGQTITIQSGDPTATWTYGSTTVRSSNNTPATWSSTEYNVGSGTTCNGLTAFCCLADTQIVVQSTQNATTLASDVTNAKSGIGVNSVTSISGTSISGGGSVLFSVGGKLSQNPTLGITTFQSLEAYISGPNGTLFSGTQANMTMMAQWRG